MARQIEGIFFYFLFVILCVIGNCVTLALES